MLSNFIPYMILTIFMVGGIGSVYVFVNIILYHREILDEVMILPLLALSCFGAAWVIATLMGV